MARFGTGLAMSVRDLLIDGFETARRDPHLRVALPNSAKGDQRNDVRTALVKGMGLTRRFGRGLSAGPRTAGGPAARALPHSPKQRVIVKAHVAKHGNPKAGRSALRAHVNYLAREGAGADGERGEFYDRSAEGLDASARTKTWGHDRHHFRFIISPENADKIADTRGYVRETMARVAQDLGEPGLDWIGVTHTDTAQAHAHVLVRGKRVDGRELFIPRDYISHGFRGRAQEVAQELLGDQSRDVSEQRLLREATSDRWTALDKELSTLAGPEGGLSRSGDLARTDTYGALMRKRLAHLVRLRLAERTLSGARLAPDFEAKLKAMDFERDVLKRLHTRMNAGAEVGPIEADSVAGRVVARGHHDEIGRQPFAILRDRQGKEHYALLPSGTALPDIGAAGRLQRFARGRAALTDLGRPETQIDQHRLTPLDRELNYRRRELEAGRLPGLFDERTEKAVEKRATFLTAEGYAVRDSRGLAFSSAGYAKLKERDVALSIQDQLETTKPLIGVARAQVSGAYVGAVSTASGVYAVLDRGAGLVAGRVAEAPGFAIGAQLELAPGANGLLQAGLDVARGLDGG
jgi:type IV secretory pathway VirD2 relaxase